MLGRLDLRANLEGTADELFGGNCCPGVDVDGTGCERKAGLNPGWCWPECDGRILGAEGTMEIGRSKEGGLDKGVLFVTFWEKAWLCDRDVGAGSLLLRVGWNLGFDG